MGRKQDRSAWQKYAEKIKKKAMQEVQDMNLKNIELIAENIQLKKTVEALSHSAATINLKYESLLELSKLPKDQVENFVKAKVDLVKMAKTHQDILSAFPQINKIVAQHATGF